jgi:hypothetical protein
MALLMLLLLLKTDFVVVCVYVVLVELVLLPAPEKALLLPALKALHRRYCEQHHFQN